MDADTIGKKNGKIIPAAIIMTLGPRLVNMMMNQRKKKMEIEFDAQMDIAIPAHLMPVVAALLTDKEERTNEQWYLLELFAENEECYEALINEIMKEKEG